MPIIVDDHEDVGVQLLLEKLAPVSREAANRFGWADYTWWDYENKIHTWEAKQIGEVFSTGLDAIEDQLSRQVRAGKADYYKLIIRGIALPHKEGIATYQWRDVKGTPAAFYARTIHQSYTGYRAWLARLEDMGIQVWELPSTEAMVAHLAATYHADQKSPEEHHTFRRHIALKPQVLDPQPDVLALMGLGAGLGEELAMALRGRTVDKETGEIHEPPFSSLVDIIATAVEWRDAKDIAGVQLPSGKRTVGPAAARRLLARCGWSAE